MNNTFSSSELKDNYRKIKDIISESFAIITSRGKANAVMLPYYEGNEDAINEYLESYEIWKNRELLCKRYDDSVNSGISGLKI